MIKNYFILLLVPLLLTGCPFPATMPSMSISPTSSSMQAWTTTTVNLSRKNYRVMKANVTGSSWGIKLLGLITLKPTSYVDAITALYQNAGVSEGKAQAFANVIQQQSSPFFVLFSIPRITVRADLVEFTEETLLEGKVSSPSEAEGKSLSEESSQSMLE